MNRAEISYCGLLNQIVNSNINLAILGFHVTQNDVTNNIYIELPACNTCTGLVLRSFIFFKDTFLQKGEH